MKIWGLVSTRGERHTQWTIGSLMPWVEGTIAVVDDRAPKGFAESLGVEWHGFTFDDDFSAIPNLGMALLEDRADWVLQLDADELLDGGVNLSRAVSQVLRYNIDAEVIALPRRHWHDTARTRECQTPDWYPDWQYRLRKPRVRMEGRVHPRPAHCPATVRSTLCTIEHFNLALRSEADWAETNALYARLAKRMADERMGQQGA